ncbi:MAG: hypothetical protein COX81_04055 [Candidatus Magasanikbacteria bacterium CG_4_10_14_0_2_um_filter_37_12]|uniref:N-acetyltransferase domain-containing protein n=1 Tax=Candidatus Magasanikbacteria bacterium CG_4_10_14_0_2_um_filter_37_12 TaxID=1974637 RepID=A0A2M7V6G0_9BACT|nr:MAG: hypothetical protein COX81_04055 [Candidatus Magasanikbacteria bacterium CG_4_10_14_0_2_um_filter_37_12]
MRGEGEEEGEKGGRGEIIVQEPKEYTDIDWIDFWMTLGEARNRDAEQTSEIHVPLRSKGNEKILFVIKTTKEKIIGWAVSTIHDSTVLLTDDYVSKEYRGKGVMGKLTDVRIARAEKKGCTKAVCTVKKENIAELKTKLEYGFVVSKIIEGRDENFHLEKQIDDDKKCEENKFEQTSISIEDTNKIKKYLNEGWLGVDIEENIEGTSMLVLKK